MRVAEPFHDFLSIGVTSFKTLETIYQTPIHMDQKYIYSLNFCLVFSVEL